MMCTGSSASDVPASARRGWANCSSRVVAGASVWCTPNGTCWAGPELYACRLMKSTGTALSVTNSANRVSQSSASEPGEMAGPPTCSPASTSLTAVAVTWYSRW